MYKYFSQSLRFVPWVQPLNIHAVPGLLVNQLMLLTAVVLYSVLSHSSRCTRSPTAVCMLRANADSSSTVLLLFWQPSQRDVAVGTAASTFAKHRYCAVCIFRKISKAATSDIPSMSVSSVAISSLPSCNLRGLAVYSLSSPQMKSCVPIVTGAGAVWSGSVSHFFCFIRRRVALLSEGDAMRL